MRRICSWCGAEFNDLLQGFAVDSEADDDMRDPTLLAAILTVATTNCADCVPGALLRAGLIEASAETVH